MIRSRLSEQEQRRLDDLHDRLRREAQLLVGYPCTTLFDDSPLYRFLDYPLNNAGDPYLPSNYHLNTHEFEREVLAHFFDLTHAPADASWGYVTNGGTECNMYGIFLARELLPDGLVYYSEDTRYSVNKILRCLHVRNIMIRGLPDGRIDLDDLREAIRIHRDVPPITFANVGTTMKGEVDDLAGIHAILSDLAIPRSYTHADAALHGMFLPFVDTPQPWDFRAGIDSIAISGHKVIGSPIPCGMATARRAKVERIARSIDYIDTLDTTLSGSRNAITPLFLWYAFRAVGRDGFRRRIAHCLEVADYAIARLDDLGRAPWRHEDSPIVVFDRPPTSVTGKWQLGVHDPIAHLIAMPHLTRSHVDRLVEDIATCRPEEACP